MSRHQGQVWGAMGGVGEEPPHEGTEDVKSWGTDRTWSRSGLESKAQGRGRTSWGDCYAPVPLQRVPSPWTRLSGVNTKLKWTATCSPLGFHKKTGIYYLIIVEARNLRSRRQHDCFLLRGRKVPTASARVTFTVNNNKIALSLLQGHFQNYHQDWNSNDREKCVDTLL